MDGVPVFRLGLSDGVHRGALSAVLARLALCSLRVLAVRCGVFGVVVRGLGVFFRLC